MKNKKGFTLTEILLAVMIVGLIGVALASLTTASTRESGVGRSRVMLRNNLSLALRQIRQDVQNATQLLYAHGPIPASEENTFPVLVLGKNMDLGGDPFLSLTPSYTTYCFVPGAKEAKPDGSFSGGVLYRSVSETTPFDSDGNPTCNLENSKVLLHNVKYIPPLADNPYPVPLFQVRLWDGEYNRVRVLSEEKLVRNVDSVLDVKLIVEINGNTVVNETVEDVFVLRNGFTNNIVLEEGV